ncbi:MAG TPA: glycosyltransferase family 4 protein [Candidatus Acidoferrales bacterium]|nr:glycosyltransferase family 4 protein [Candidatus Acidoferrales bacterium]
MTTRRPRLAVVSPFIDRHHGTERYVAEWVSRLADQFEIHVYSQNVEGLDSSRVIWHKISKLPGPHILNYLWWFTCNHFRRKWDARFAGRRYDLTFSPGINCLDADVISVHIVFAELLRRNPSNPEMGKSFGFASARSLHRRLYYRLIALLEKRIYANPETSLILITQRTAAPLQESYGRTGPFPAVYFGLDHDVFSPQRRLELRDSARQQLHLAPEHFALLLIGNGWQNKGLPVILEAMGLLPELPLHLLVVGSDDPSPYQSALQRNLLAGRAHFLPVRNDVEFYYSAADIYVGPSKEDVLPLPPAEAMACGVPVIVSAACGISEIISDGDNGIVVPDPSDAGTLAEKIRQLYECAALRSRLSEQAISTVQQYTWERNAREFAALLIDALERKHRAHAASARQDAS